MALLWHVWNRARYCVWECAHYSVRSRNANSTRAPSAVYRLRLDIRQQALSQCTSMWVGVCALRASVKVCALRACCVGVCALYACAGVCASSAGVECGIIMACLWNRARYCVWECAHYSARSRNAIALIRRSLSTGLALSQCKGVWVGVCALCAYVEVRALSAGVECGIMARGNRALLHLGVFAISSRRYACVWKCGHYASVCAYYSPWMRRQRALIVCACTNCE